MFAVIETGGKQYRVEQGDTIEVECCVAEDGAAQPVKLDRVLLVGNGDDVKVGSPVVEGAVVVAAFLGDTKGPKIRVFKKKRRKGYKRTNGHRQQLQRLRIEEIHV